MYVCICHAVTERQVRQAVEDGVHTLRALRDHLGVASECGKCAGCAHGIIKERKGCATCEDAAVCLG